MGGKLQVRLDRTVDHIPLAVSKKSKARCQLHRIFGKETQSRMLFCPKCNVHLCAWCYHPYHNVEDLNSIKKDVLKPHQSNGYLNNMSVVLTCNINLIILKKQ